MRPLVLPLLLACALPALAEDSAPQPERRTVPVSGPGAEDLAKAFAGLKGTVKGIPEGWDAAATVGKDPFFTALSQLEGFKSGERSAVIEGGEFKGILITHDGKSFLYKPPQPFAAAVPKDGSPADTVLSLKDGRVAERKVDTLSPQEQAAARALVAGRGKLVLADPNKAFDGTALRGDGVFLGGKRQEGAGVLRAGPFKAVERPKGDKLPIVNEYKGTPPSELKPGQLFWDGKTLMAAGSAGKDGAVMARAVGYMADMKDEGKGDIVFWHGGASPDKKGAHPAGRENWSLYYLPKLEKHMEAVEGNNTAYHVSRYAMMDFTTGKVVDTPDGRRMDLRSVMQDTPVVLQLPPADPAKRNSLHQPEVTPLFRFGAPVKTKDKSFQSFVDMRGNRYQEQESGGQKWVVKTGQLYNLKEPASPSDKKPVVPILIAPVQRKDPPAPKPDPFAPFEKTLASKLPSYLESAAKTIDYDGFSPSLAEGYAKQRRELEIAAANGKADKLTPWPAPGGAAANEGLDAVRKLAALKLTDSGDIVRRTRILQGALASQYPEVRQAAAEALAASGEFGRDARHALAATAVLDLNPMVRAAAALALPKVDPSNAQAYRVLPEFPKPPTPKPVYGPQPAAPPVPAKESDLVAALKLPPEAKDRQTAVDAAVLQFGRMNQDTLEAEKARNELATLLDHRVPLTRSQAAGALLAARPDKPDERAVRTLAWFADPASRDVDPSMRAYALTGLRPLASAPPGTLAVLVKAAEDTRESPYVRREAFGLALKLQPTEADRKKLFDAWSRMESMRGAFAPPQQRPQDLFRLGPSTPFDDPFGRR